MVTVAAPAFHQPVLKLQHDGGHGRPTRQSGSGRPPRRSRSPPSITCAPVSPVAAMPDSNS
ncbi:hypothetical protein ACWC4J_43050, partial [Streptomyces sp. NPDC001356]